MKTDFLIIKYTEQGRCLDVGVVHRWAKITPTADFYTGIEVSREKAKKLIEKAGFVELHRDKDGVIWGEPNEDFRLHFGKRFSRFPTREVKIKDAASDTKKIRYAE